MGKAYTLKLAKRSSIPLQLKFGIKVDTKSYTETSLATFEYLLYCREKFIDASKLSSVDAYLQEVGDQLFDSQFDCKVFVYRKALKVFERFP